MNHVKISIIIITVYQILKKVTKPKTEIVICVEICTCSINNQGVKTNIFS